MNFSVVLIARNEEKTLPRLLASLAKFKKMGGEIILVDTGSTDKTAKIAKKFGCIVEEVGDKFVHLVDKKMAKSINARFIINGEEPVVGHGDRLFDFAMARNYAASLAKNDMIAMPDCDEEFTRFDLRKVNEMIENGVEQLEYNFVFSHDADGNELIKFLHCKFYNRRKMEWQGIIHEILVGEAKREFVDESIIKLEHWQNEETNRGGYLKGLSVDCFNNPDNDRNSHYLGREMVWTGRLRSGIKELKRHIAMEKWIAERAQSMIFIGDAYGLLNEPEKQVEWYNKAFYHDSTRRIALLQLANFYLHNQNWQAAACYAAAAIEIPWNAFYANFMGHYTYDPHRILYIASGWLGNIQGAQYHIRKALEYQPMNSDFLRDLRFYYDLPKVTVIIPQLGRKKGLKKAVDSIKASNYPEDLIDIKIIEGPETVPVKVKKGLSKAKGDYILYASNDIEFRENDIIIAVFEAMKSGKALVSFNTGVRNPEGYICEHFIIRKDFIPEIGGEIFDTDFHHVGVDDLLWKKCEKLGQAMIAENTRTVHNHFSRIGSGVKEDAVIKKGWAHVEEDRKLLKKKLAEL